MKRPKKLRRLSGHLLLEDKYVTKMSEIELDKTINEARKNLSVFWNKSGDKLSINPITVNKSN